VLIGGKAAHGYHMAKSIIKLVNNVARVVNKDKQKHHRIDQQSLRSLDDRCGLQRLRGCPGTGRHGLSGESSKVMENLRTQGFHLQMPPKLWGDLYEGD
jgi:hypothetical protein